MWKCKHGTAGTQGTGGVSLTGGGRRHRIAGTTFNHHSNSPPPFPGLDFLGLDPLTPASIRWDLQPVFWPRGAGMGQLVIMVTR